MNKQPDAKLNNRSKSRDFERQKQVEKTMALRGTLVARWLCCVSIRSLPF